MIDYSDLILQEKEKYDSVTYQEDYIWMQDENGKLSKLQW